MFKVLLIVVLVLVALVLVRTMFMRRDRSRELFVTEATGRAVTSAPPPAPVGTMDTRPLEHEVIRLLEQRKKIQAIKVVRQHSGLGLAEAKFVVEEVERTGQLRLPEPGHPPTASVDEDVLDSARRLKTEGKAIEAIKLIRQHTRLGLKEAKDVYDTL
jgi:ribosomal protein L7/L12